MYQQPPLTVSEIFNQPFDSIGDRSDSMENRPNSRIVNAYQRLRDEQHGPMRDHIYNPNGNRSYSPYSRPFDNRAPSQAPAPNNHHHQHHQHQHHHHHHQQQQQHHQHHHRHAKNDNDLTANGHSNQYLNHPTDRQTDLQVSRRLNGKQKYYLTRIYISCKDGVNWTEVTNEFNEHKSRGQITWSEIDVVTAFETLVNGTTLPDGKSKQAQSDIENFWSQHAFAHDNRNGFATRRLTSAQVQVLFDVYSTSEGRIDWTSLVARFNKKKPPQQIRWDEVEMVTVYEIFSLGAYLSNCHECRAQARKNITKFWRTTNRAH